MSSGFNLGQSGNATEAGAGVVKLATQAQIDAQQADDGGVPLVATPDKLPRADAFLTAEAGEDILKGQPLTVGDGADSSTLDSFAEGEQSGSVYTDFTGGARWFAQRINIPVGKTITSMSFPWNAVQSTNATISLRETLTGPDLTVGTRSFNVTNGSVVFRSITVTPYDIVEGQDYFIIFRTSSGSINTRGSVNDDVYGEAYLSLDSGATWNPHPNIADMFFLVSGVRTTEDKIYLATTSTKDQFAGFAQEAALKAANVNVNTQNYLAGLYDGVGGGPGPLTVGQKYYFSATPGELATTGSDLLGIAPNVNDLLRLA